MPQGYALDPDPDTEIVSAYSVPQSKVPAVETPPGWFCIGSFQLPKLVGSCRLEAVGVVSSGDLAMTVALFDTEANTKVTGSDTTITNTDVERKVSAAAFPLSAGRVYLVIAQCSGAEAEADDLFGTVLTGSLVNP
jgi:hypothetical protein